jgi:HEAT repeat protein
VTATMDEVREALEPDEPNYAQAASLGPTALPHLAELVESDRMLAPKAVYLAGVISGPDSPTVVLKGARSSDPGVRVAAAGAATYLPTDAANEIILTLLGDDHAGVRKAALQSIPRSPSRNLRALIATLAQSEQDATVQAIAKDANERLSRLK